MNKCLSENVPADKIKGKKKKKAPDPRVVAGREMLLDGRKSLELITRNISSLFGGEIAG